MIPEAVVAMLACARLGAPHSVVFGGFSAEALAGRILDLDARVVITADGGYRRGAASGLKVNVDQALEQCPDVRTVLVIRRTGQDVDVAGRARRLVARRRRPPAADPRARGVRRRAAALCDVHERHDRQAQGDPAHDRGLSHPCRHHPPAGVRPQGRRRTSSGRPPTSGG